MVPLELELNRNNDLGEDSAASFWETGDGMHFFGVLECPKTLLL